MTPKIAWPEVPDDRFEEIIGELLRALGYEDVTLRRGGGGDDGWDIDARLPRELPGGDLRHESWRIECKRYKKSPPPALIRDHFYRMAKTQPTPDHVLFVTTARFSRPTLEDLKQFAADERVEISVWQGDRLDTLVRKHLDNPRLWELVEPYADLGLPLDLLARACRHQVKVEIQRRVGRKYLPELCQDRPLEHLLSDFLYSDLGHLQVQELANALRALEKVAGPASGGWGETLEGITAAPDLREARSYIDRLVEVNEREDVCRAIKQAVDGVRLRRNCFLVRDKAGSGKTNLLCRLAESERPKTLFLFLSCKLALPPSRSLQDELSSVLESALRHESDPGASYGSINLIQALDLTLRREGAQLVVLLDGINENRDLAAFDEALTRLLLDWNNLPVKFVVTCRDIFWSFFDQTLWAPFLFERTIHELPGFEERQIDGAIEAYFRAFGIRGHLAGAAREKCKHPLILRFFCEAYSGRDIRDFQDLRLKDLFDEYWRRKREEIAESLGQGNDGGRRVEMFVMRLVDHMADRRATQVLLKDVVDITGEGDLDSDRSLYQRLLDQDVILEELPPETAFDRSQLARRVGFVYDEFYDYMMALAHVRNRGWDDKERRDVCLDFLDILRQSDNFEQIRGIAEYLVLLSEAAGLHRVLCATLARLASHEILCNVLPKLRDQGIWMGEVLRCCLLSYSKQVRSTRPRSSTGWELLPLKTESLLKTADPERLYEALTETGNG